MGGKTNRSSRSVRASGAVMGGTHCQIDDDGNAQGF